MTTRIKYLVIMAADEDQTATIVRHAEDILTGELLMIERMLTLSAAKAYCATLFHRPRIVAPGKPERHEPSRATLKVRPGPGPPADIVSQSMSQWYHWMLLDSKVAEATTRDDNALGLRARRRTHLRILSRKGSGFNSRRSHIMT